MAQEPAGTSDSGRETENVIEVFFFVCVVSYEFLVVTVFVFVCIRLLRILLMRVKLVPV